jgi:hypothetical protein
LFDRAAGFLPPRPQISDAAAQETVKAGRRSAQEDLSDASRPRLDSPEHGGSIDRSGQLAATAPTISTRRFDNFKPVVFDQFHAAGDIGRWIDQHASRSTAVPRH